MRVRSECDTEHEEQYLYLIGCLIASQFSSSKVSDIAWYLQWFFLIIDEPSSIVSELIEVT